MEQRDVHLNAEQHLSLDGSSLGNGRRELDESTKKLLLDTFWHEHGWLEGVPGSEQARRLRANWKDPAVRKDAVRLLVTLIGDPLYVTFDDFRFNRMSGLLTRHYENSPWKALSDAGYDIKPFEMAHVPIGYFEKRKNRQLAMRWLLKATNKTVGEISAEDFRSNGLGRILDYYNGSPHFALCDIGHQVRPERRKYSPQRTFDSLEKRQKIVSALIEEVRGEGRRLEEINVHDFRKRNLGSMLKVHYGNNPQRAVKEFVASNESEL